MRRSCTGRLVSSRLGKASTLPNAYRPGDSLDSGALSYFRKVDGNDLQLSSFVASRTAQDTANYRVYLGLGYKQDLTSFAKFTGRTFYGAGTYDGNNADGRSLPDEVRSAGNPSGAWLGSNWQLESKLFEKHTFSAGMEYRRQMDMPLMEITELKATASGLQRWALIQSWSQFKSWLAWLCAAFLAVQLVFLLLAIEVPLAVLLAGMTLGTLPSLFWALPREFSLRAVSGSNWVDVDRAVSLAARGIGYMPMRSEGRSGCFRQRVPAFMRWREAEIRTVWEDDWLRVSGPSLSLRALRRELLNPC